MRKLKLTANQRRKTRTRLRETHDVRLYHRLLAVLEFDRGTPVSAIAELLSVSCQSVYNWITRFQHGRGDGCKLTDPVSGMVWLLRNALDCPAIEEAVATEYRGTVFVGYDTPHAA